MSMSEAVVIQMRIRLQSTYTLILARLALLFIVRFNSVFQTLLDVKIEVFQDLK